MIDTPLALRLHEWHTGMDSIYALGSCLQAGTEAPTELYDEVVEILQAMGCDPELVNAVRVRQAQGMIAFNINTLSPFVDEEICLRGYTEAKEILPEEGGYSVRSAIQRWMMERGACEDAVIALSLLITDKSWVFRVLDLFRVSYNKTPLVDLQTFDHEIAALFPFQSKIHHQLRYIRALMYMYLFNKEDKDNSEFTGYIGVYYPHQIVSHAVWCICVEAFELYNQDEFNQKVLDILASAYEAQLLRGVNS